MKTASCGVTRILKQKDYKKQRVTAFSLHQLHHGGCHFPQTSHRQTYRGPAHTQNIREPTGRLSLFNYLFVCIPGRYVSFKVAI
jgi:hypothetical protein